MLAALALLVVGCSGCSTAAHSTQEEIALGFGRHIAQIDAQLVALSHALPTDNGAVRANALDQWRSAIGADTELRVRVTGAAPGGKSLRTAATSTRHAARALWAAAVQGRAAPSGADLDAARTALSATADALEPRLPPSAAGTLHRLRDPWPVTG